jgi:TctA family transporter
MLFSMILTIGLGILLAIFFGLIGAIPSIHINNILPIVNSFIYDFDILSIVIISGSIIFSFITFIPSALFFVPSESSFVSVMPMQKLHNEGKAYFAIYLASIGGLYGFIFSFPLIILFIFVLSYLEPIISILTPIILILTLILLIANVKNYFGYFVILFSGALGYLTLQSSLNVKNPLFVMITGLFGLSAIYSALISNSKNTKQYLKTWPISNLKKIHISIIASILSIFVTLFPGIGSGIATYFGVKTNKFDEEDYIMLNGAINTLVIILSFFSAIYLQKTRTGSAVYFLDIANTTIFSNPIILMFLIIFSVAIGFIITLYSAKRIIILTEKSNQKNLCLFAIIFILISILLFSNIWGFIIATVLHL